MRSLHRYCRCKSNSDHSGPVLVPEDSVVNFVSNARRIPREMAHCSWVRSCSHLAHEVYHVLVRSNERVGRSGLVKFEIRDFVVVVVATSVSGILLMDD